MKFSKNQKLNKVLSEIYEELKEIGEDEILRYRRTFPNEKDYNIFMYGNVKIYNYDIEQMYKKAGYKTKFDYIETYKRQIRYIADLMTNTKEWGL